MGLRHCLRGCFLEMVSSQRCLELGWVPGCPCCDSCLLWSFCDTIPGYESTTATACAQKKRFSLNSTKFSKAVPLDYNTTKSPRPNDLETKKTPRNPMPAELHRPTTLHVLHLHPTQNINDAPKSCSITKGAMYARTQPRIRFNVGLRNVRRAPVVGIAPKDRTGTITAVHRRDPLALEGRFRSSTGTVGVAVPCEGEGRWKGQTSLRRTSACKHPLHRSIIAELHKAAVPLHLVDPVRSVVHRY